ncbi:hypothetical protein TRAPUB_11804 [Trametes pubescens]|uniref:MYND-type domain-containing protein n=1 Tax=Trametes pubescens TaxID=154538 RepID=A0A1M2VVV0_TRAPU|nr:hypothetical protein TRAPUB_11804 [Trametes pubescens]
MNRRGAQQCTEICAYPTCTSLGEDNLRCWRCKTTYYCTRIHQLNFFPLVHCEEDLQDVQRHNAECGKPPAAVPRQQRPGTRSLNVLLFPTDEDAPRVIQTECRIDGLPDDETHHINFPALLHTLAVTSQPVAPIEPAAEPGASRTRLYLAFDDCFAIDDAPPNRVARALTGGRAHTQWAGTLVGFRLREPAAEMTQFEDVGMADVPAFTAFLAQHGAPPPRPTPPTTSAPPSRETISVEDMLAYAQGLGVPVSVDEDDDPFVVLRHEGPGGATAHAEPEPTSELPAPAPARRDEEEQRLLAYRAMLTEEFTRQRTELRHIVTEESTRALLTTVALAVGAYGVWCLIVVPILALPGILIRAVVAVLGGILRMCWRAVGMLFCVTKRGA